MRIYSGEDKVSIKNPVVTIGIFDGVHLGHQQIITKLNDHAHTNGGETVLLTFWPHPRMVLGNNNFGDIQFLTTQEEKYNLLERYGIQHEVIIPFTPEFAALSADEFVKTILVDKLSVKHLVVGYNHHFGHNREGTFEGLLQLGNVFGFTAEQLNPEIVEGIKISSSLIRKLLNDGKIEHANKLLGHPFCITGKVERGKRIGSSIGFPTANIHPFGEQKLIPPDGVYAVVVEIDHQKFSGMLNIGYRPTVDSQSMHKTIEVNIFDFNGILYDREIIVYFFNRLRNEMKFNGLEELKMQLQLDKLEATLMLKKITSNF